MFNNICYYSILHQFLQGVCDTPRHLTSSRQCITTIFAFCNFQFVINSVFICRISVICVLIIRAYAIRPYKASLTVAKHSKKTWPFRPFISSLCTLASLREIFFCVLCALSLSSRRSSLFHYILLFLSLEETESKELSYGFGLFVYLYTNALRCRSQFVVAFVGFIKCT